MRNIPLEKNKFYKKWVLKKTTITPVERKENSETGSDALRQHSYTQFNVQ